MNKFEYVENKDTELYTLVEEVINNNYSNQEIEESFDEFNLLLESISVDEIKKYVQAFMKSDSEIEKEYKDVLLGINKEEDELKKWYLSEIDKLNKELEGKDEETCIAAVDKLDSEYHKKQKEFSKLSTKKSLDALNKHWQDLRNAEKSEDYHKGWLCMPLFNIYVCTKSIIELSSKTVTGTYNDWKLVEKNIDECYDNLQKAVKKLRSIYHSSYQKFSEDDRHFLADAITSLGLGGLLEFNAKTGEFEDVNQNELKNRILKKSFGTTDKSEVKDKIENPEIIQNEKETKEDVTDVISDNSDLITPLAKAANVTADKLAEIVSKLCKTKTGKSRKLDPGVITGLSIMICGILLTVKKNGKNDRQAIVDIVDRLNQIIAQKKGLKKILEFREFVNTL